MNPQKPKHSPGPWSFRPNPDTKRSGWYAHEVMAPADGRLPARRVALTDSRGLPLDKAEANAKLMAAATDLLAALVDLAAASSQAGVTQKYVDAALAAIAKAVG